MRRTAAIVLAGLASCADRAPAPPGEAPRELLAPGGEAEWAGGVLRPDAGPLRGPEPLNRSGGGDGGAGGGGGSGGGGPTPRIVLTDLTDRLRIPSALTPEYHHSGGIAAFDADGDDDLDLLILSDENGHRYLINEGDFRFTDASHRIEGTSLVRPIGAGAGDCDADGDIDILVGGREELTLLLNEGGTLHAAPGRLVQYPDAVQPFLWGSTVFFDGDGDGDLDIWAGCYNDGTSSGCPDRFFVNDGTCHFVDEARENGFDSRGYALAGAIYDLDDDGDMDVLVSNDFGMSTTPNRAFRNNGFGSFTEISHDLGLDVEIYAMSALVADLDGDSQLDLYVSNFARNPMFSPRGGSFLQRDEALGIDGGWIIDPTQKPVDIPFYDPNGSEEERRWARFNTLYLRNRPDDPHAFGLTAWAASAVDLDQDGTPELHVANGSIGIIAEADHQPDRLYQRKDGGTYVDVAPELGLLSRVAKRTAVWADLDGDGDQDGLIGAVSRDETVKLQDLVYRNDTQDPGHHIRIRLRGRAPNLDAVGALVTVRTGTRVQTQLRTLATSFLSANTGPMHFGVGEATVVDLVTVRWPGGKQIDRLAGVPVDGVVTIQQPAAP